MCVQVSCVVILMSIMLDFANCFTVEHERPFYGRRRRNSPLFNIGLDFCHFFHNSFSRATFVAYASKYQHTRNYIYTICDLVITARTSPHSLPLILTLTLSLSLFFSHPAGFVFVFVLVVVVLVVDRGKSIPLLLYVSNDTTPQFRDGCEKYTS